jgi:superfamily II DNA or RNA helicase
LWTHLKALRPELLAEPGYDSFIERYCITKTVDAKGHERIAGHLPGVPARDLKKRLETFRHRVRKRDALPDLPPVLWTVVPVAVDDLEVPEGLIAEWRATEAKLKRDIGGLTGDEALSAARASPHSATERRLTGLIKAQAMVAAATVELDDAPNEKLIVFAYHKQVIETLTDGLKRFKPAVINADRRLDRFDNLRAFQTDKTRRLAIVQIDVGSEAIDLSVASNVWIMESDWTPKTMTQAAGRAHRPGQKKCVNVRILALAGSIDLAIQRVLERKARAIEEILEPDPV